MGSSTSATTLSSGQGARVLDVEDSLRRKLKGRWTKEEHDSFLIGLRDRGKDWEAIERDYVPTRSGTQIRTHAQKYFRKFEQGLPFPDEPYASAGGNFCAPNPEANDAAVASSFLGPADSSATAAASPLTLPTPSLGHSTTHRMGFGGVNLVPDSSMYVPQERSCSLPPLGLQTDLDSHLFDAFPQNFGSLKDFAHFQSLGDDRASGDGKEGGQAMEAKPPAASAADGFGLWPPFDLNMGISGDSLDAAAMRDEDESSNDTGMTPSRT